MAISRRCRPSLTSLSACSRAAAIAPAPPANDFASASLGLLSLAAPDLDLDGGLPLRRALPPDGCCADCMVSRPVKASSVLLSALGLFALAPACSALPRLVCAADPPPWHVAAASSAARDRGGAAQGAHPAAHSPSSPGFTAALICCPIPKKKNRKSSAMRAADAR